jgi:hypothetical protein
LPDDREDGRGKMTYIIMALMAIYIVYKDIKHGRERKDMLNRLMSQDMIEYRSIGKRPVIHNNRVRND